MLVVSFEPPSSSASFRKCTLATLVGRSSSVRVCVCCVSQRCKSKFELKAKSNSELASQSHVDQSLALWPPR